MCAFTSRNLMQTSLLVCQNYLSKAIQVHNVAVSEDDWAVYTLNVWMACWWVRPCSDSPFTSNISSPERVKCEKQSRDCENKANYAHAIWIHWCPTALMTNCSISHCIRSVYIPSFSLPSAAAAPLGKMVLTNIPILPRAESCPPTILNPRP